MLWLLEPDIFAPGDHPLRAAVLAAGQDVELWNDEWWEDERFPSAQSPVLFHGSLGNAHRIAAMGRWQLFKSTSELPYSR